jgi:NAD+ kinase
MPLDLVLVRHGESEGNVASRFAEAGDNSVFSEEFCNRHNSRLRLTDRGRQQASAAGDWIKRNIGDHFDRYLVSGYLRAMETAALLELPAALWYQDFYLRERDMGLFDMLPEDEKRTKYPQEFRQYEYDPFYWMPPNGESVAQLCLRVDRVLQTLHRECADKRVVIVCHGMVMWAFIIRIERLTPKLFLERSRTSNVDGRIRNGQVIQFSRRDPQDGTVSPHCNWVRSVCPWGERTSNAGWRVIKRPIFSNQELLEEAGLSPRVLA